MSDSLENALEETLNCLNEAEGWSEAGSQSNIINVGICVFTTAWKGSVWVADDMWITNDWYCQRSSLTGYPDAHAMITPDSDQAKEQYDKDLQEPFT